MEQYLACPDDAPDKTSYVNRKNPSLRKQCQVKLEISFLRAETFACVLRSRNTNRYHSNLAGSRSLSQSRCFYDCNRTSGKMPDDYFPQITKSYITSGFARFRKFGQSLKDPDHYVKLQNIRDPNASLNISFTAHYRKISSNPAFLQSNTLAPIKEPIKDLFKVDHLVSIDFYLPCRASGKTMFLDLWRIR